MKRSDLRRTKPLTPKRKPIGRLDWFPRSSLPMRKTALKKRSAKYQDIPPEVRAEVATRAHNLCEVNASDCDVLLQHLHHVRSRAQGGRHEATNILACCRACHATIHANPKWAHDRGYLYSAKWAAREDTE